MDLICVVVVVVVVVVVQCSSSGAFVAKNNGTMPTVAKNTVKAGVRCQESRDDESGRQIEGDNAVVVTVALFFSNYTADDDG